MAAYDEQLLYILRELGDTYGPEGVAKAAVSLTDLDALIESIRMDEHPAGTQEIPEEPG